jgi:ubiquinone/menaquinone biosynthesis C-methylase UbiE
MADDDISRRMREDWNARAREDAGYFVAFGRRYSDDAQFFATATEVINRLEWVLSRVPLAERGNWRALEVGCGPGRLMRPMSRHFVEIHGVDVSDEMIALSKEKLRDIPNAHTYVTDGSTLPMFADESFDFVYSYAVFQHIPAREVIVSYLREIHRVMKTGGLAVLHFNGLINRLAPVDTWDGVRFSSNEVLEFAGFNDFQVLALEGAGTQYMWSTWRKRPTGWIAAQKDRTDQLEVRVRRITNANSSEPVAPCRGRFASISIWVENLPDDIGLHHLQVMVGNSLGTVCFIGPRDYAGMQQINVILPQLEATGLLPVEILWLGRAIAPTAVLRVIPPGPSVPRIRSITDGINQVAENRIETRYVKVIVEEIVHPDEVEARIDGMPLIALEYFCIDPRPQRFELNFRLPDEISPGAKLLDLKIGRRKMPPMPIDVVA